jgi:AcrR family transcriptional regulator
VADTRGKLIDAALDTIRTLGIAGVSARTVATAAGVNQALVFYHFGTVDDLLAEACLTASRARVESYRTTFAQVSSLRELLDVGRKLHEEERALGNVTVLAQMLAGAQSDARIAEPTARALGLWVAELETVLARLLAATPIAELADPPGLARAVAAAFIGLELFEGVDPAGAAAALDSLDKLATLIEVMDDLGPVAQRAVRAKIRRPRRRAASGGSSSKSGRMT